MSILTMSHNSKRNWGEGTVFNKITDNFRSGYDFIHIPTQALSSLVDFIPLRWEDNWIDSRIEVIDNLFLFENYSAVFNFLRNNEFLIPLLFECYLEISKYFGYGSRLILDIVNNPDTGNEDKMYLIIDSEHNSDKSYALLDQFDEDWWFKNAYRSKFLMNIDMEI